MIDRQDRAKTFVCDLPLVKAFADWASNPNTDQASVATCTDAAVNLAVGIWTLKSERLQLDPGFNF